MKISDVHEIEVIPEIHYYKGCKTILTSEDAALAVAETIFNDLGEG
jgi:hypothetical protein